MVDWPQRLSLLEFELQGLFIMEVEMNKQTPLTDDDVMCQGHYVCEEEPQTFWKTVLKHILQV